MPKVELEVGRLTEADAHFVSIVKNGATRIPFRITKGEGEVGIDLGKISRTLFQKAEGAPSIVAVLVRKSADVPKIEASLLKAGIVVTQKSETDDAVVYEQPGAEAGSRSGILKFDNNVSMIVSGLANIPVKVRKDFEPWNIASTSYGDVLATDGFWPCLHSAKEALHITIMNCMQQAEDATSAAAMIAAAIDAFKDYVMPLIAGIPVRAFKAESGLYMDGVITSTLSALDVKPNPDKKSMSGIGEGRDSNGTGYDAAADKVAALKGDTTKPAAAPKMVTITGPDGKTITMKEDVYNSMVNSDQGARGPTGQAVTSGGEMPPGMTTKEPDPVGDHQEPSRPTGNGGKVAGAPGSGGGDTMTSDGHQNEPDPVGDHQGRSNDGNNMGGYAAMMQQIGTGMVSMMKAQETTAATLATLGSTLTAIQKGQAEMGDKVTAAVGGIAARVAKAEQELGSTVVGGPNEDPADNRRTREQKGDGNGPPLLDTAFTGRP